MLPYHTIQTEINLYEIACKRLARGLQLASDRLAKDKAKEARQAFRQISVCTVLGIKQSQDHVTSESLNHLTGQAPLLETIRERQLKFTGQTTLISMNPKSGQLFDQAPQGRNISNKFRPIFYLTIKRS